MSDSYVASARPSGASRPILFSGPMVRALLAGAKTQTRRLIPQAQQDAYDEYDDWCRNVSAGVPSSRQWEPEYYLERTRIKTGDRLWVRETWTAQMEHGWTIADARSRMFREKILYAADGKGSIDGWWPSIHMPREFSRLTLTVTEVRVVRLQDISEEDARAEGAYVAKASGRVADSYEMMAVGGIWFATARGWYAHLWDRINGEGAHAENPWVAVYDFRVHRCNIDQMEATDERAG